MKVRNVLVAVVVALLVLGTIGSASADLYQFSGKSILLVDVEGDGDSTVTAAVTDWQFVDTYGVYYKTTASTTWTQINFSNGAATLEPLNGGIAVDFALKAVVGGGDYLSMLNNAKIYYSVPVDSDFAEHPANIDYYKNVYIQWIIGSAQVDLTVLTSSQGGNVQVDGFAPVPLPEAFWLLGSGLIALVGIRRKAFFG